MARDLEKPLFACLCKLMFQCTERRTFQPNFWRVHCLPPAGNPSQVCYRTEQCRDYHNMHEFWAARSSSEPRERISHWWCQRWEGNPWNHGKRMLWGYGSAPVLKSSKCDRKIKLFYNPTNLLYPKVADELDGWCLSSCKATCADGKRGFKMNQLFQAFRNWL